LAPVASLVSVQHLTGQIGLVSVTRWVIMFMNHVYELP